MKPKDFLVVRLLILLSLCRVAVPQKCCIQLDDWKTISRSTVSGLVAACAKSILNHMAKENPEADEKDLLAKIGHEITGKKVSNKRNLVLTNNKSFISDGLYEGNNTKGDEDAHNSTAHSWGNVVTEIEKDLYDATNSSTGVSGEKRPAERVYNIFFTNKTEDNATSFGDETSNEIHENNTADTTDYQNAINSSSVINNTGNIVDVSESDEGANRDDTPYSPDGETHLDKVSTKYVIDKLNANATSYVGNATNSSRYVEEFKADNKNTSTNNTIDTGYTGNGFNGTNSTSNGALNKTTGYGGSTNTTIVVDDLRNFTSGAPANVSTKNQTDASSYVHQPANVTIYVGEAAHDTVSITSTDNITTNDVSNSANINEFVKTPSNTPNVNENKTANLTADNTTVGVEAKSEAKNTSDFMESTFTHGLNLNNDSSSATANSKDLTVCLFKKLNTTHYANYNESYSSQKSPPIVPITPVMPNTTLTPNANITNTSLYYIGTLKECKEHCGVGVCDIIPPANVVWEWTGENTTQLDNMISMCISQRTFNFRRSCYGEKSTDNILFKMLAQGKFNESRVHAYIVQIIALYGGFFPDSSRIIAGTYMTKHLESFYTILEKSRYLLTVQDIMNARQRLQLVSEDFKKVFRESRYKGKREIYKELIDEVREKLQAIGLGPRSEWAQSLLDTLQCEILNQDH